MRLLLGWIRRLFVLLLLLPGLLPRWLRSRRRPRHVRFRLAGDPPYHPPRRRAFWRRPEPATVTSLEMLDQAVDALCRDGSLEAVVFEVEGLTASLAKRQALVRRIDRLRGAGKKVVGYAVTADSGEYELLCAMDEVWMPPAGRLELIGFAAEATALGRGLRQLGVEAHFVRRGDHKTAPEMFTHDVVSPIQRQTLEVLLDERYEALVSTVAAGRELPAERVKGLIDEGPYSARRALDRGLIDALVSGADLAEKLGQTDKVRLATFRDYASTFAMPPGRWKPLRRRPVLGVVPLQGMITHGKGGSRTPGGQVAGSDGLAKALRAAGRSRRCRAVLLHIDSPGGSALASELILDEVQRLAKKKPVVAYFDRVAASGGYMAALGAREIWAAPQAIAGSIGVFGGKFELSGLFERLGVSRALVTRGQNAALFSSSRGFSPSERASLEADIDETYEAFLAHVATARRKSRDEIHARAEGRIYSGTRAREAGLVDELGQGEDAGQRALALAEEPTGPFDIATFAPPVKRLGLLSALRAIGQSRVFALWYPWLSLD